MIQRAFRYKLAPTPEQAETLAQFAGVTRFVYNLALEQRRTFWRQYRAATGSALNYVSQGKQVTQLRAEVDWINAVPSTILTQALRDLDRAFANFWSGRAGFPTPRKKGCDDRFRCQGKEVSSRTINSRWAIVKIPKLGWVKFRASRPMRGCLVNATVVHNADGWFISFACQIEHEVPTNDLPAVGIDRGVANTIALSTGELLSTPDTGALDRRKRRAQRGLARRVRGSRRYRKQRARVARLAAKIVRVRADWRHKTTTAIVGRFGFVGMEALKVANMTASGHGKRGLNRIILEQGWGRFETTLAYKLEERGGSLVKVHPAFTSQECSACGTVDSRSRESQARFVCVDCGFADHADTNAAKNILRRSTSQLPVEASGYGADEAGTVNHALAA